ncbi:MAG: triose-phosphate isomerase [bacterium]
MNKILVVANWKMNPQTLTEAKQLFDSVKKETKAVKNVEVIICPPFLYIPEIQDTKYKIQVGSQDCFWEQIGAFTGEISPLMLKELGCRYVILGHSERRKNLKETDEMVNKKIRAVLEAGLKPILCIKNLSQLKKSLKGISEKVIIAYEPVFAIGTGKPCSIEKAKKMRKAMAEQDVVLYGGSVNSQNVRDYLKKAGFQGLLIGGASLKPKEFTATIKKIDPR